MELESQALEKAKKLIGHTVRFENTDYRVHEILEQSHELVLTAVTPVHSIQTNQYGYAHRKTPATIVIPILSADKSAIHPEFESLKTISGPAHLNK